MKAFLNLLNSEILMMRILARALSSKTPTSSSSLELFPEPTSNFVPTHDDVSGEQVRQLAEFVRAAAGQLLVMTGAGISTESGLPDYRSEGVGLYARSTRRPIQHSTFLKSEAARKSYWARNFVGWPRWSSVQVFLFLEKF